jgi:ribosome-binding factor A
MDPITRGRINSSMQSCLAELLEREVRDPRIERVTITGVEVAGDLAVAKVHYSVLGDTAAQRVAQRGLEQAAAFLRREVGRRLRLRTSPQLRFHFDASLATGERIETLLRELRDGTSTEPRAPGEGD